MNNGTHRTIVNGFTIGKWRILSQPFAEWVYCEARRVHSPPATFRQVLEKIQLVFSKTQDREISGADYRW